MKNPRLANITVGEILAEDYLKPMGLNPSILASALHVPRSRINAIIRGKQRISPDSAIRLSLFFKTNPGYWLDLQAECDRRAAEDLKPRLAKVVRPYTDLKKAKAA